MKNQELIYVDKNAFIELNNE